MILKGHTEITTACENPGISQDFLLWIAGPTSVQDVNRFLCCESIQDFLPMKEAFSSRVQRS
jgi:hypothetical protein